METLLFGAAGFAIGWIIVRRIYDHVQLTRARNIVQALGEISERLVMGKVEQIDDVYFVYDELSQEFLAQGRNWEEIRTHFKSRFPGKVCAIDQATANAIPRLTPASE